MILAERSSSRKRLSNLMGVGCSASSPAWRPWCPRKWLPRWRNASWRCYWIWWRGLRLPPPSLRLCTCSASRRSWLMLYRFDLFHRGSTGRSASFFISVCQARVCYILLVCSIERTQTARRPSGLVGKLHIC